MSDFIIRTLREISGLVGTEYFIVDDGKGDYAKIKASNLGVSIGSPTAPTVVSATCPNGAANTVVVVFDQSMTAVTTVGWSFKKNGSAWSVSSVTGSGTTWTFTMGSSAVFGDTLLRSYDSTTGATIGTTLEVVSFTDSSVTNSVASGVTYLTWASLGGNTQFNSNHGIHYSSSSARAVANQTLAAGAEVVMQVPNVLSDVWTVYLTASPGDTYAAVSMSTNYGKVEAGSFTGLGVTCVVGDWIKLKYAGTVITVERSTNTGGSWTTIGTIAGTHTATLGIEFTSNAGGPDLIFKQ